MPEYWGGRSKEETEEFNKWWESISKEGINFDEFGDYEKALIAWFASRKIDVLKD